MEEIAAFVLDYLYKSVSIENSLGKEKLHLSLEQRAGLLIVQYNKNNDCLKQRSGGLLGGYYKRFSFPILGAGVSFL